MQVARAVNFNPRTREGCDRLWAQRQSTASNFNPRTREGCDPTDAKPRVHMDISIHAPVKGATLLGREWSDGRGISIHAPVKGATGEQPALHRRLGISIHAPVKGATTSFSKEIDAFLFQSTHP